MWRYSPRSPPSCVLWSSFRGSVLRYMRVATPEHTVSISDLLRTAICEQIVTSIGKFIADKALYSPDAFHGHTSHPTYLPSFFSSLTRFPSQDLLFTLNNATAESQNLEKLNFSLGEFLSARLTMPGRKSNKEQMKIDWGSALGTLELSSIPLKDKRSGMGLRDTWALS